MFLIKTKRNNLNKKLFIFFFVIKINSYIIKEMTKHKKVINILFLFDILNLY